MVITQLSGIDWSTDPNTNNFTITFPAPIPEPVDCAWLYENTLLKTDALWQKSDAIDGAIEVSDSVSRV
jgi:hypothetical protein